MGAMIEAHDLTKYYDGQRGIDGLSFEVEAGEIFGFLGPNGAGKTTTIRLLIGQLRPTRGRATVAGYNIVAERENIKNQIGVVFEYQNLYERLSGRQNLTFFAELYGLHPGKVVDDLLERMGLGNRGKVQVKHYSKGMKQRLLLARALLNSPKVLFLDEPTVGLDPHFARQIRRLISDLGQRGTTIFLTTHYIEEAAQLCDRVAIIDQGRVVALDTPRELMLRYSTKKIRLELREVDGIDVREFNQDSINDVCRLLKSGQVLAIHSLDPSLEEVFIRLTGRGLE